MWSYFTHKDMSYSLRKGPTFGLPKKSFILLWFERSTVYFRGSLICNNLTAVVKSSDSLFEFKNKIKDTGDIYCESPATDYLNSKIKLKILEILIVDV